MSWYDLNELPYDDQLKQCYGSYFKYIDEYNLTITDKFEFKQQSSLYYYIPKIKRFNKVIIFDLDWTLAYHNHHLYVHDADDINILPNRREVLEKLVKKGYSVVIITNQFCKKDKKNRIDRVRKFLIELALPVYCFIATDKDNYRKPNTGFKEVLNQYINNIDYIGLIGDALGREGDFDDSDKVLGQRLGIKLILSPEQVFRPTEVPDFKHPCLIMMVGAPGSGKSSYYDRYLSDLKLVRQDELKTKPKVISAIKSYLSEQYSVVVDSTNPKLVDRENIYKLVSSNYSIYILYFVRDGHKFNSLRSHKVPDIVYHIFHKNFDVPTAEEGNLYKVWF